MQQNPLFGLLRLSHWALAGGKYHSFLVGYKPLLADGVQAGKTKSRMRLNRLALVAVLSVQMNVSFAVQPETVANAAGTDGADTEISNTTAPAWWPWKAGSALEKPPEVTPYQIPTMAGDGLDYHAKPAPLVQAPAIDADAVFSRVIACYPERSKFDIDVDLRAAIRSSDVLDLQDTATGLGKSYVGIVASMPLYSGKELEKEKDREYARRKDAAKAVADFVTAIAGRNHAVRELALYRSLEARSAMRVQQGLTEASEQVGYLEKVASSQDKLISEEAQIMESRLLLSGMCNPTNAKTLGGWLKKISAVPDAEK